MRRVAVANFAAKTQDENGAGPTVRLVAGCKKSGPETALASVFAGQQQCALHQPYRGQVEREIAERDVLAGDVVVVAIGAADGEAVALFTLQVPDLEGLPSYSSMQLVAADQVDQPVRLALLSQGFHAVGEYESGQLVAVEIFGSVVDLDEVVCVLHTKQFCF